MFTFSSTIITGSNLNSFSSTSSSSDPVDTEKVSDENIRSKVESQFLVTQTKEATNNLHILI